MVQQLFDMKNTMCSADPREGRYISAAALFRGKLSNWEIDSQLINIQSKYSTYYVEWIGTSKILPSFCDIAPQGLEQSATLVANSTAINEPFKKFEEKHYTLFKRKAFLHWYTAEGMEELEF